MSLFIGLAIVGQLLFAIVALIDKYIVTSGTVPRPVVYTFYSSLLSVSGILFFFTGSIKGAPQLSNIHTPSISFAILSIIVGLCGVFGLWALFEAFKNSDTSDVIPIHQSILSVSSILMAFFILNERISNHFLIGFVLLVLGTTLISRFRLSKKTLLLVLVSGVLAAGQIFLLDILSDSNFFNNTNRDNAFFWTRITTVLAALLLMLLPNCCGRTVKDDVKQTGHHGILLVVGNRVIAGIAGLTFLTAITVALPSEVAIVNALGGLQFVFLLIFALLFGHKTPYACGENCTIREKIQKTLSVTIILLGFILLFI